MPIRFARTLAAGVLCSSPTLAQCLEVTTPIGPGTNAPVTATIEFGGELFIGGPFTRVDGLASEGIARWTGQSWQPVGGGVSFTSSVEGSADAFAVWDDGTGPALYAGGNILKAGEVTATRIARWDGSSWSALGLVGNEGLSSGAVQALHVHDDGTGSALYAAGDFRFAGGQPADRIARWDGTSWTPLGSGLDRRVYALASFDFGSGPELVVAGDFTVAGGAPNTRLIARWDGSAWNSVGNGLVEWFVTKARGLAVFDDGSGARLHVAGSFEDPANPGPSYAVVRWNGVDFDYIVQSVSTAVHLLPWNDGTDPQLVVSGVGPLSLWDGQALTSLPFSTSFSSLDGVPATAVEHDDGTGPALYVGGSFNHVSPGAPVETEVNHITRWDGATWQPLGSQPVNIRGCVEDFEQFDDGSGLALYAGGGFLLVGAQQIKRMARWDGASWSAVGPAAMDKDVHALEAHDDGSGPALYAGGSFNLAGGVPASKVARWDGHAWSAVGGGLGSIVRVLASHDDGSGSALYAGGGGQPVSRWDGNAWSTVGVAPGAWSMAVYDGGTGPQLFVGFGSNIIGQGGDVWSWDGQTWTSIGPTDVRVRSLHVFDDGTGPRLFAGGGFSVIAGIPTTNLASWDGTSWTAVPTPLGGRVKAMTTYDGGGGPELALSVGRQMYTWAGNGSAGFTNFFDATYEVVALEAWGPDLYIGSESCFASGDDKVNRWGPSCFCPSVTYCTAGTSTNGCTALMSAAGIASHSLDTSFDVRATGIEGVKQGLIYFGTTGPKASPWGAGTSYACVQGPHQRLPVQASGGTLGFCDGAFEIEFNAWMAGNPAKAPAAGDTAWIQAWYRDPPAPKTTNLSDALEFYVCP